MPDVLDVRSCTTPWPPPPHGAHDSPINVRQVVDAVSLELDLPTVEILSPRRGQEYWIARNLVAYLCRELLTHYSRPAIGRQLHRDHTTVLHNCRRWRQRRQRADMRRLENAVRQRLRVD